MKFEYSVFRVHHDDELHMALKEKGNEGFELVHIRELSTPQTDDDFGYRQTMDLIFKKGIE